MAEHLLTKQEFRTLLNEQLQFKVNENWTLKSVPLFQQHRAEWQNNYPKLSFEDWWNMEIINVKGVGVTRKKLVLNVANKDGGTHINSSIPQNYYKIKNAKLTLNINGKESQFERNVVYASVTQIGWELLNSIRK